jgi:hypothetical protein
VRACGIVSSPTYPFRKQYILWRTLAVYFLAQRKIGISGQLYKWPGNNKKLEIFENLHHGVWRFRVDEGQ